MYMFIFENEYSDTHLLSWWYYQLLKWSTQGTCTKYLFEFHKRKCCIIISLSVIKKKWGFFPSSFLFSTIFHVLIISFFNISRKRVDKLCVWLIFEKIYCHNLIKQIDGMCSLIMILIINVPLSTTSKTMYQYFWSVHFTRNILYMRF